MYFLHKTRGIVQFYLCQHPARLCKSQQGWMAERCGIPPCSDAGAGSGGERRGRNHFRARLSVRLIDYECALLPVLLLCRLMLGLCSQWRAADVLHCIAAYYMAKRACMNKHSAPAERCLTGMRASIQWPLTSQTTGASTQRTTTRTRRTAWTTRSCPARPTRWGPQGGMLRRACQSSRAVPHEVEQAVPDPLA